MLLPEKTNPVEDLPGSRARRLQSLAKLSIFQLESLDSLRGDLRCAARSFHCFHPSLGLKGAATEARELVAKMTNELLKLEKRFDVRTIVV